MKEVSLYPSRPPIETYLLAYFLMYGRLKIYWLREVVQRIKMDHEELTQ